MDNTIQRMLVADEAVTHQGVVSVWSMLPLVILGFLFLAFMGAGVLFWLAALIQYMTTKLALTNKRVVAKCGIMGRQTIDLPLKDVSSIQVEQGILGHAFNFGTLVVSGKGTPEALISGIANPMAFRQAYMEKKVQVVSD